MQIRTARQAAAECLRRVEEEGAYANLAMTDIRSRARLSARDAAFATELAFGAIRMRGLYDAVLGVATKRTPESLDAPVLRVLRLGAHQALGMRVPVHAAVSETVSLARLLAGVKVSGLVNAAMRRVTERSRAEWIAQVAPDNLALETSHPDWVANALESALMRHGAAGKLRDALEANNVPARVVLAARPGLTDRDALVTATQGSATRFSPWGVTLDGGNPESIDEVTQGLAGVQDEGSQLAALAAVSAPVDGEDSRWLDMCAGPGGKTALMAGIAHQRGARVDATELHEHRTELVRAAVKAMPTGAVEVHTADAEAWAGDHAAMYDRILLDAPCTGLGALRRRPEARWRRTADDLADLTRLQRSLVGAARTMLRPGGVLTYVTCSPVVEETLDVIATWDGEVLDARQSLAKGTGTEVSAWGDGPTVQLWPHVHGTDAMFVAQLALPGAAR